MKTVNFKVLVATIGLSLGINSMALAAPSSDANPYTLEKLDKMKTCQTAIQKENAQLTIRNYLASIEWNMKDQMSMFHPDFIFWHSTLAGLSELNPAGNTDASPFKNGQMTKDTYIKAFSVVAYNNDIDRYGVVAKRLDCVGDETVVLITYFKGYQVKRDVKGCITHALPWESFVNSQVTMQEGKLTPTSQPQRLIYRLYSHMDLKPSLKVRAQMEALLKIHPSPIEPLDPSKCKTLPDIINDFSE